MTTIYLVSDPSQMENIDSDYETANTGEEAIALANSSGKDVVVME